MDYNWFFSALSQSAAAIVGIFSAFIITKIINNQHEFTKNKLKIKELLSNSQKLVDDLGMRYFDWINKYRLKHALEDLQKDVLEEKKTYSVNECLSKYNFPNFLPKSDLINTITEKLEMLDEMIKKPSSPSSLFPYPHIVQPFNIGLYDKINNEEEIINQLITKVRLQVRTVSTYEEEISTNPQSSSLITFSIISVLLLFFVGVIYPLSFLPFPKDSAINISFEAFCRIISSFQGILLIIISLIFSIVLGVFFFNNIKMKYKKSIIEELVFYSEFVNYSPYLKILEENNN